MKSTRPELPTDFVAARKRRRIIDAMATLTAEHGYEGTKIADVVREAGVARKTLYDNFSGKEEILLAAVEVTIEEAVRSVERACEGVEGDWRRRVNAGLEAFLSFVAAHPAGSRMCLIEAQAATRAASERYDEAMRRFVAMLRDSSPRGSGLPDTTEETLVGGVAWIVYQRVRRGEAERAADMHPELSEFLLSPYHGVSKV